MEIKKVCIFCASSQKTPIEYCKAAEGIATILATNNIAIVYGGGAVGLMGCVADAAIKAKGEIHGVIPKFMHDRNWGNPNVTSMQIVESMQERKYKMIEGVDAVIALPGGFGTLEELAEIITQKQLGLFTKPIIILNTNGFYNPLLQLFERMITDNFIREKHLEIWHTISHPDQIIDAIKNAADWHESIINIAQI